jgi:hypothetical protein
MLLVRITQMLLVRITQMSLVRIMEMSLVRITQMSLIRTSPTLVQTMKMWLVRKTWLFQIQQIMQVRTLQI